MRRAAIPVLCAFTTAVGGGALAASPSPPLVVADVPTYRGDMARTGRMPGPGPSGTPVVRWRLQADAPLAVPVVSDRTAYVVDDGGAVHAADLGTGSERWTVALGAPSEESPPLVADGLLVVGDASGGLHALALPDGKPSWTQQLDGAIDGSPASSGRSIVVGTMDGTEYMLDEQSGSIQQRTTLPGPISRSTALSGDTAFVSAGGTVSAVSTLDGKVLWQTRLGNAGEENGTPSVADGLVVVAVGIEGGSPADHALVALDGSTGSLRWRYASPSRERVFPPAVVDGHAYTVGKDGLVVALDVITGRVLWHKELGQTGISTPSVIDGTVYVGLGLQAPDGPRALVALDTASGSTRWTWSSPTGHEVALAALDHGTVLVTAKEVGVVSLEPATGRERWMTPMTASAPVGGALVDRTLVAVADDGSVVALDTASGSTRWSARVEGTPGPPVVVDGRVIVATSFGAVVALGDQPGTFRPSGK